MSRPAAPLPPRDTVAAHNRHLGRRGEELAARHLTSLGMVVLDRNWRCDAGEIDLVLRDGRVLVICEVKTRSSRDYGDPVEAVDRRKADRLRRLGVRWLLAHSCHPDDVRVDLVGVLAPPGGPVEVEHVEGVG
ncbi:YraN family protein [Nocardioides zeicaulis]|uniref:UPF0102 protein ACFFJG_03065 n=1 Tax=Nocardioides zeicaulis TaxID=1776857 RepID=A0ABV6DXJ1_9ACTN